MIFLKINNYGILTYILVIWKLYLIESSILKLFECRNVFGLNYYELIYWIRKLFARLRNSKLCIYGIHITNAHMDTDDHFYLVKSKISI